MCQRSGTTSLNDQNISRGCSNPRFQSLQGAGKLLVLAYLFCPNINLHVVCVRKHPAGDFSVSGNTKSDHIFNCPCYSASASCRYFCWIFLINQHGKDREQKRLRVTDQCLFVLTYEIVLNFLDIMSKHTGTESLSILY